MSVWLVLDRKDLLSEDSNAHSLATK